MSKIYVGDVGTKIILNAGCDISSAQLIEIVYIKPNGTIGTWKAKLENSQSASYIIQKDDFDSSGEWAIQLRIIMPNWRGSGEIVKFPVYKSLGS